MQVAMERTVKKEVRLTKEEAKSLRELARGAGVTESDVLRAGIRLTKEDLDREERRRQAWDRLAQLAVEVPGKKIPFRMK